MKVASKSTKPLWLRRIEAEQEHKTGALNLHDCGLSEIPKEVFAMDWLEELVITNFEGHLRLSPEHWPVSFEETSIAHPTDYFLEELEPNHLTHIPKAISQLKNLKRLHLGGAAGSPWSITEIAPLLGLVKLEELNLGHNRLLTAPQLMEFQALKHLKLPGNSLEDAGFCEYLNKLVTLDLRSNRLATIFFPAEEGLPLLELYLCENQFGANSTYIELGMFSKLKILDLAHNDFSSMSFVVPLQVEQLYLQGNSLSEVHFELPDLKTLSLANNQLSDIMAVANAHKLRSLDISYNHIENLEPLRELTALEQLIIDALPILTIQGLDKMSFLKSLSLRECQLLQDIEGIQRLSNLRELALDNSAVQHLEPVVDLPRLANISCQGVNAQDVPPEIVDTNDLRQIKAHFQGLRRDLERSATYQKDLEQVRQEQEELEEQSRSIAEKLESQRAAGYGDEQLVEQTEKQIVLEEKIAVKKQQVAEREQVVKRFLYDGLTDVKLVLVGNSGVGKTQLSKFLVSNKHKDQRESTHGIRMDRWEPKATTFESFSAVEDKVVANIWDFGGQEFYHETFRLFLSNHAIYILLWDRETNKNEVLNTRITDEEDEELQHFDLSYWLDNIKYYAPASPVLVVQNKVDERQMLERVDSALIEKYQLDKVHHISLHEAVKGEDHYAGLNFQLFCEDLAHSLQEQVKRQQQQLRSSAWLRIRDYVVELVDGNEVSDENPFSNLLDKDNSIAVAEFEEACREVEAELSDEELYTMPRWLNQCGLVIYVPDQTTLEDRIFVDPFHLTAGIYKILDDKVREEKGRLDQRDIQLPTGFAKTRLLPLMEELEIVFPLNQNKVYIAPQYLPEQHLVEELYDLIGQGLQSSAFYLRLPLYFHRQLLRRLIYHFGTRPDTESTHYWKTGIAFSKNEALVLIRGEHHAGDGTGVLMVSIQASTDDDGLRTEIFSTLLDLLDNRPDPATTASRAIASTVAEGNDFSPSFKVNSIAKWLNKHQGLGKGFRAQQLEIALEDQIFVNYEKLCSANEQRSVFLALDNSQVRIHDYSPFLDKVAVRPLKVFVSYSHRDTDLVNRLAVHLATLKRQQRIEVWTDQAILPGEQWDDVIKENLHNADLVLLMLSADFVNSTYIWEKELAAALETKSDGSVVPIYLRPFAFEGLVFASMEMVPKTPEEKLLAVSKWPDFDSACRQIVKDLEILIDQRFGAT